MKKVFASIILILFFFNTVHAQRDFELFKNWYEYLNIPEDFSTFPNLIYLVFIPFLAVMAIVFGVLTRVFKDFFDKRVRIVLAFVFAFSLLYLGPLTAVVSVLLQVGSVFSVVAFFVMFFVLSAFFIFKRTTSSYGKAKEVYSKVQGYEKGQKDISNNIVELQKQIGKLSDKKEKALRKIAGQQQTIKEMDDFFYTVSPDAWGGGKQEFTAKYKREVELLQEYRKDERRYTGDIRKLRDRIEDLRKKQREMELKLK